MDWSLVRHLVRVAFYGEAVVFFHPLWQQQWQWQQQQKRNNNNNNKDNTNDKKKYGQVRHLVRVAFQLWSFPSVVTTTMTMTTTTKKRNNNNNNNNSNNYNKGWTGHWPGTWSEWHSMEKLLSFLSVVTKTMTITTTTKEQNQKQQTQKQWKHLVRVAFNGEAVVFFIRGSPGAHNTGRAGSLLNIELATTTTKSNKNDNKGWTGAHNTGRAGSILNLKLVPHKNTVHLCCGKDASPVWWLKRRHPPKAAGRPANLEDQSLKNRRKYAAAGMFWKFTLFTEV